MTEIAKEDTWLWRFLNPELTEQQEDEVHQTLYRSFRQTGERWKDTARAGGALAVNNDAPVATDNVPPHELPPHRPRD